MKRPVDDETPSFDFDAEPPVGVDVKGGASCTLAGESPAASISQPDSWREVPQALFLSWSAAMQDSYCAARDDDSAKTAHVRGEDPQFYIGRAKAYRGR